MEAAFSWLGQVFEAILLLFPRVAIIRATHGGVKWRCGSKVIALAPGLHIWWPLISEIEILPTARQTHNVPTQVLTTRDNKKAVIGIVVVYRINNVILAFGQLNWDVDTTVNDIAQAAVVSVIAQYTFVELLEKLGSDKMNCLLTQAAKKELDKFGVAVQQAKITDFAECRVLKIMLDTATSESIEE